MVCDFCRAWELILNRLSNAGFLAIIGVVIYWAFLENPPLADVTAHSRQTKVIAGQHLMVTMTGTKSRRCPVSSVHHMTDSLGTIWSLPGPIAGWNEKHGHLSVTYKLKIPREAAAGPAIYREVITYICNPIRSHLVTTPEVTVTILDARPGGY